MPVILDLPNHRLHGKKLTVIPAIECLEPDSKFPGVQCSCLIRKDTFVLATFLDSSPSSSNGGLTEVTYWPVLARSGVLYRFRDGYSVLPRPVS